MDPAAVLTVAAQGLELSGQERAYAEASAGLLRWWRRASGVVVPRGSRSWRPAACAST
ncbi:hypothetical protein ACFQV2_00915 [Actinokineospora soli]|uniref:Uncharacterized protein n=1 Tax=Actinokineospora soli TaxID=1048753 RepID=A0ABW2TF79_9PSEU